MLPSKRLIVMVLAAAPMFLAGAFFAELALMGLLYLGVLGFYMLLDVVVLLPRRSTLEIVRELPERLSLGVATRVLYHVRNNSRRRLKVWLAEDLPEHIEIDPAVVTLDLGPRERTTVTCRIKASRRGRYEWKRTDVRILPRLGLWHRQFVLALDAVVEVYPNLHNVRRHELQLRRGLSREQGLARLRQIGQGWEFESLRHYVTGDPMSRIDWKATAKRSALIVRNYEIERQQSVMVALDVGRATAGEFEGISRLDYLVNAALMLSYVVLRQGDWFSLVAFSDHIESYLPPLRGLAGVDRVARALHLLEPRLVESDYGAACRFMGLKNRKRSLLCLMTDVIDRQASGVIIGYMARYARYHLPLAVTLANPEIRRMADAPLSATDDPWSKAVALDVQAAREEALQAMRHQGVDVLDVEPRQLSPELIDRYLRIKATRRL